VAFYTLWVLPFVPTISVREAQGTIQLTYVDPSKHFPAKTDAAYLINCRWEVSGISLGDYVTMTGVN